MRGESVSGWGATRTAGLIERLHSTEARRIAVVSRDYVSFFVDSAKNAA